MTCLFIDLPQASHRPCTKCAGEGGIFPEFINSVQHEAENEINVEANDADLIVKLVAQGDQGTFDAW